MENKERAENLVREECMPNDTSSSSDVKPDERSETGAGIFRGWAGP